MRNAQQEGVSVNYLLVEGHRLNVYSQPLPYANTNSTEIEAIMANKCVKKFFLKAVEISSPQFSAHREYGIYNYGGASAELKPVDGKDCLKIEVDNFEKLPSLREIKEKIWAGKILPTVSYEKKQISRNCFNLLKQKWFGK